MDSIVKKTFMLVLFIITILSVAFYINHSVFAAEKASPLVRPPQLYCLSPKCQTSPTQRFIGPSPTIFVSPNSATISQPILQTHTKISVSPKPKRHDNDKDKGSKGQKKKIKNWLQQLLDFLIQLLNFILGGTLPTTNNTISPTPGVSVSPQVSPSPVISNQVSISPGVSVSPQVSPSPVISTQVSKSPTLAPTSPIVTPPVTVPVTQTGNWSGYVFSDTGISSGNALSATWNTSTGTCSVSGNGLISPWIGFGGAGQADQNIAQLGNDIDCTGQVSSGVDYSAWTEQFPAPAIYINDPVKAGDIISASVTYNGSGQFSTVIKDITAGWVINTPMSFASSYVPKTGEAIVEDVLGPSGPIGGVPQFSPSISFTNVNYTTNVQTPLEFTPQLDEFIVVQHKSQPFAVSGVNGPSFKESWQSF